MVRLILVLVTSTALMMPAAVGRAEPRQFSHKDVIPFSGPVTDAKNLSGIALIRGIVAICADETAQIDLLKRDGDRFEVIDSLHLDEDGIEIDMEGMAGVDDVLYVIGSHSLARKKVDPEKSRQKNRKRLVTVAKDKHRYQLFRLKFAEDGALKSKKRISLRKSLRDDPLLSPFTEVPSKENGVDIEAIAVRGEKLYVGFRGPVLRGNYVPVMELQFDDPEDYQIKFVNLNGDGIRDMAAVEEGFLIVAGPVGDRPAGYSLFLWNGKDCLAGEDSQGGKCELLGTIEPVDDGKAEGIAVERETDTNYELLMVFDGVSKGVYRFVVPK
jgi:hypothetical protein